MTLKREMIRKSSPTSVVLDTPFQCENFLEYGHHMRNLAWLFNVQRKHSTDVRPAWQAPAATLPWPGEDNMDNSNQVWRRRKRKREYEDNMGH